MDKMFEVSVREPDRRAIEQLSRLCKMVSVKINASLLVKELPRAPFRDIISASMEGKSMRREDSITDLAKKGDVKARETLIDKIVEIIYSEKIGMKNIERILRGYYINYFGTPRDICSEESELLDEFLNLILLDEETATEEDKIVKLAQIVYQESWGYGVLDEFRYLGKRENGRKVEELLVFGPTTLHLTISGNEFKLDKLQYPKEKIEKATYNLSLCSTHPLNIQNPKVETELLDGSRVTLSCPPLNQFNTFNIRLHYSGSELTPQVMIKYGSSTAELESFYDMIMLFHPRIALVGPQNTGKTTDIVNLCRRFERDTVIITAETSYELNLQRLSHLTVESLRLNVIPDEDFLTLLFRQNAKCLILGEVRSPAEAILATQAAQRTKYGTMFSFHASTVKEGIIATKNALMRSGNFSSGREALQEILQTIDIAVIKDVDSSGKRYVKEVAEVCKRIDENEDFKTNVLFRYDEEKRTLKKVNNLTDECIEIFSQRAYNPAILGLLKQGKYLYE